MSELIGGKEFINQLSLEDLGAYTFLLWQLREKVGEVHPVLSQPNYGRRYPTVGDGLAAALTYGEIVGRQATDESPQLPEGAHLYSDAKSRLILAQDHLARVERYLTDGTMWHWPGELGGAPVVEFQDKYGNNEDHMEWVDPVVEGNRWFRGLEVSAGNDSAVIILVPYMMPWEKGGAPFPALYAIGDPDPERVRQIVSDYCANFDERPTLEELGY